MLTRYLPSCQSCTRASMYRYCSPSPASSPLVYFGSLYRANLQQRRTSFVFLANRPIWIRRSVSPAHAEGLKTGMTTGMPVLGSPSLCFSTGWAGTKLLLLCPCCYLYPERAGFELPLVCPCCTNALAVAKMLMWTFLSRALCHGVFTLSKKAAEEMRLNLLCLTLQ